MCIRDSGMEDPSTASCYGNLGNAYGNAGESEKALEFLNKGLEIDIKIRGSEHPSIAISYTNIGLEYQKIAKHKEADECFEKAFKIQMNAFGDKHPYTAIMAANLLNGQKLLEGTASDAVNSAPAAQNLFVLARGFCFLDVLSQY
eukprot:TRINITY_DN22314_c0_g1_i1.p2 TRINITY_DN22314_c0_g1~~TRINITY_DN22314_c0_g1_i1.p2  ORF type:complete len:166 (-),score=7.74 TRINITY_DN22314_c0_g1_i1:165-599(-)